MITVQLYDLHLEQIETVGDAFELVYQLRQRALKCTVGSTEQTILLKVIDRISEVKKLDSAIFIEIFKEYDLSVEYKKR